MATSTTKLGLIKPDFVDVVDITDLNSNADDIDAAVGFTICTNATRPASPYTGQSIFETDTGDSFIWDGSAWQPGGGGGSIEISATAPASPAAGDLWWDSDNGNLYIYYDDGDSQQWVAANGPQVFVGTTAPAGYQGQLWFDSTTGKVYIYYDDGSSAQWVSAIGGSIAGTIKQVVSTTKIDAFSTTSSSFVDVTGLSVLITPSSATSKILVSGHIAMNQRSVNTIGTFQLVRNSTPIAIGTPVGSRPAATGSYRPGDSNSNLGSTQMAFEFLDSPSATSPTTYKIQVRRNTGTLGVNTMADDVDDISVYRLVSTITAMEVAG